MPSFFITHPEVDIEPTIPIQDWGLSDVGFLRAQRAAGLFRGRVTEIVSSTERKAIDAARVLSEAIGVGSTSDVNLGEMDRSATGYLLPHQFEPTVDAFFAQPEESIRGWERAVDAQRRIERAVRSHLSNRPDCCAAFVAHGGVGALLLASLTNVPISRELDQPGMGSYFTFDPTTWRALTPWVRIDSPNRVKA